MGTVVLRGRVIAGRGEGAAFTQLPWVRAQFVERLGIDPFPGTLNLWLEEPAELQRWNRLKVDTGIVIEPASPEFCEARGFPAVAMKRAHHVYAWSRDQADAECNALRRNGQPAAIILPDVPDYPEAQVELIAPVSLRKTLGLQDGDILSVHVGVEQSNG